MSGALTRPLSARWLRGRLPARTIRLRLTIVYGALFLVSGALLLAITYFLVQRQFTDKFFISSGTKTAVIQLSGRARLPRAGPVGRVGPVTKFGPAPQTLAAAARGQSNAAEHQVLVDSAMALAIMAVLSIWLGWVIAGRALAPLRTITNAARDISASNLHRRLALEGPDDELRRLGTTFNELLERLEASFDAQRRFVTNASHELRTPLTYERALLEVALGDPHANVDSLRRTCRQVLAVGEQQERLIEALLTLARSQRGIDRHEPVDLAAITAAASRAADDDGLTVETETEPAVTTGDPRLVERLVANLVGNAVRHNVRDGHVSIRTTTRDDRAVLTVANSGPAITPGDVARLYVPFERLDSSRSGDRDGLGLGLSIVHAIARAHGAAITTHPRSEGGLEIAVTFPAATVTTSGRTPATLDVTT